MLLIRYTTQYRMRHTDLPSSSHLSICLECETQVEEASVWVSKIEAQMQIAKRFRARRTTLLFIQGRVRKCEGEQIAASWATGVRD